MSLGLGRSTWTRIKLGDAVRHVTDRVTAETDGLSRFLAGEHIPSRDLEVQDWGQIGRDPMGPMFYKRFRPGHVLYVSRRAYLRKTAVPDFEGICGEKTFVMETKDPSLVSQDYLPFLLSADKFHAYAESISRGSVNPYVNWTDLTQYECEVPPRQEQERISDLLWAIEKQRRAATRHLATGEKLLRALRQAAFAQGDPVAAATVFDIEIGRQRSPKYQTGQSSVPYLRSANVKRGRIDVGDVLSMDFSETEVARFALSSGDVLVTEGCGSPHEVGAPARWSGDLPGDVCYQNTLLRYRAVSVEPEWLWQWSQYAFDEGLFRNAAAGTGILHIGLKRARSMTVHVPDSATRSAWVRRLNDLEARLDAARLLATEAARLLKAAMAETVEEAA